LLRELPRTGREVLILHHLLGMSFHEVGQILGIATGTAKVRAHRALKTLRTKIQQGDIE
jgi:RNA polymerase sigma-70 factor (ECF subfamily)